MPKHLLPIELQFIDKYLKESGVRYDDIRYEMTDHVATAIEEMDGDFNENFRSYMINHKKELMDSNRAFKKLAWQKAFGIINKNLVSYTLAVTTGIIFLSSYIASSFLGAENIAGNLNMTMIFVSSLVYIYFLYYKGFSKASHSVIDRLLTIVYIGSIFIRLDNYIENPVIIMLYYSFMIAFFIVLIQSLWKLKQHYKLRYNG